MCVLWWRWSNAAILKCQNISAFDKCQSVQRVSVIAIVCGSLICSIMKRNYLNGSQKRQAAVDKKRKQDELYLQKFRSYRVCLVRKIKIQPNRRRVGRLKQHRASEIHCRGGRALRAVQPTVAPLIKLHVHQQKNRIQLNPQKKKNRPSSLGY